MNEEMQSTSVDHVARYLGRVLEHRTTGAQTPDGQPIHKYGAGHLGPTFWADAPWRLEPDQDEIPFTFLIRDAQGQNVKMRLSAIAVYEAPDDDKPWEKKDWQPVRQFTEGLGLGDYP
jgi:hypothetical protein